MIGISIGLAVLAIAALCLAAGVRRLAAALKAEYAEDCAANDIALELYRERGRARVGGAKLTAAARQKAYVRSLRLRGVRISACTPEMSLN